MTEPTVPDALYTKVVNLHDRWYREIYIGSSRSWRFIDMIEIEPEQAAVERPDIRRDVGR